MTSFILNYRNLLDKMNSQELNNYRNLLDKMNSQELNNYRFIR